MYRVPPLTSEKSKLNKCKCNVHDENGRVVHRDLGMWNCGTYRLTAGADEIIMCTVRADGICT